jgi:hypothetical protein
MSEGKWLHAMTLQPPQVNAGQIVGQWQKLWPGQLIRVGLGQMDGLMILQTVILFGSKFTVTARSLNLKVFMFFIFMYG